MKYLVVLVATLFLPILPWISVVPLWVAKEKAEWAMIVLAVLGVVLDIWWGTPLGLTALFLIGVSSLVRIVGDWWPSDQRMFVVVAVIFSAVAMEAYLVLV